MLLAFAAEEVDVVLGHVGAPSGAARDLERQRGEVRALDIVVEVRGREDEAIARRLHRCPSIIATVRPIRLHWEQRTQGTFSRALIWRPLRRSRSLRGRRPPVKPRQALCDERFLKLRRTNGASRERNHHP